MIRSVCLFLVVAIMAFFSCNKPSSVSQTISKNPIVPVDTLAMYESKMQGTWNLHGTHEWWCYMCGLPYDSSESILDTFGFIFSNDSTLVIPSLNGSQYNDTLKLFTYNNYEISFSNYGLYYTKYITYLIQDKSLAYYYRTSGHGMGYSFSLNYP